jgi:hypothetical protein
MCDRLLLKASAARSPSLLLHHLPSANPRTTSREEDGLGRVRRWRRCGAAGVALPPSSSRILSNHGCRHPGPSQTAPEPADSGGSCATSASARGRLRDGNGGA